jgi:nicotinate phosphoribosyltransferase
MKRSDSPVKVLNPGRKRLWRVYDDRETATADVLSTIDETMLTGRDLHLHHHARPDVVRTLTADHWSRADELLVPVLDEGGLAYPGGRDALDDLTEAAKRRTDDVDTLDPGVRRLVHPHTYHVSITDAVFDLKRRLLDDLA